MTGTVITWRQRTEVRINMLQYKYLKKKIFKRFLHPTGSYILDALGVWGSLFQLCFEGLRCDLWQMNEHVLPALVTNSTDTITNNVGSLIRNLRAMETYFLIDLST
jgi:hypothetical protein